MLLIFLQTLYITLNITIMNLNAQIIEKSEELGCFNPLRVLKTWSSIIVWMFNEFTSTVNDNKILVDTNKKFLSVSHNRGGQILNLTGCLCCKQCRPTLSGLPGCLGIYWCHLLRIRINTAKLLKIYSRQIFFIKWQRIVILGCCEPWRLCMMWSSY